MTLPRSDHFNGKTFFQSHHATTRLRDFWRWQLTAKRKPWPDRVPFLRPPPPPLPREGEWVATWIGHATFLLQTTRGNVLIDPVFSERVSPFSWIGPRRVHPPGLALDALPPVHAVLLSHDHYDHCDTASLEALAARHNPLFVAPLRHRDLLGAAGARRIAELDWWESTKIGDEQAPLSITLTPTKHWSNRFGSRRNHRLWGGFYLHLESAPPATSAAGAARPPKRLWFVGDSGYDPDMIRAVRQRLGPPDLALVPIGAYEPRWFMAPMHMNPAESVRLHREVGARLSIGMHWGTFRLADEGRDDPLTALQDARVAAGVPDGEFRVLQPGESVTA